MDRLDVPSFALIDLTTTNSVTFVKDFSNMERGCEESCLEKKQAQLNRRKMSCLSENVSVAVRVSVSVNENPRISADTIVVGNTMMQTRVSSLSLPLSLSLNISFCCTQALAL